MIFSILLRYVNKLLDMVEDQGFRVNNIEKDIDELRSTLNKIETILNLNEEANSAYIENCCNDLVDIGYEARDVLDDFFSLPTVNLSTLLPSNLELLCQYANDIQRVTGRFESKIGEIWKYKNLIGALRKGSTNVPGRPQTGSFDNKQKNDLFVGREDDKNKIMEILDSNDSLVRVVQIWGMGGIGKTTLAQSIYNDERVKEKYLSKNRCWWSVGENKFSAEKIIGESCTSLVEKFTGNRFLIVLDDMWDVDGHEWDLLFNPLTHVGKGGVIIITTRIRIQGVIDDIIIFPLNPLCSQDCLRIYSSYAIDGATNIVEKFKGLPLAAKVARKSPTKFHDDVMSTLRWSYNRLQPHLKKCFTYCALFPKGHVFDKKELGEMWMAHDLGGEDDIMELVNASLLQYIDEKYVMHDMIHDLALLVSNEVLVTENALPLADKLKKARHITIIDDDDSKILRNLSSCNSKRLYTLCTIKQGISSTITHISNDDNHDIVQTVVELLERMRVLILVSSTITRIPDCISRLKHLRYLDVSKTIISSLPDSLCHLHNLQTLVAPPGTIPSNDVVSRLRSFRNT